MGFDKDDTSPIVNTERRTTKVNVWMAVGIVAFFIIAAVVVWALWADPSTSRDAVPLP